jgi:hypothetical protein
VDLNWANAQFENLKNEIAKDKAVHTAQQRAAAEAAATQQRAAAEAAAAVRANAEAQRQHTAEESIANRERADKENSARRPAMKPVGRPEKRSGRIGYDLKRQPKEMRERKKREGSPIMPTDTLMHKNPISPKSRQIPPNPAKHTPNTRQTHAKTPKSYQIHAKSHFTQIQIQLQPLLPLEVLRVDLQEQHLLLQDCDNAVVYHAILFCPPPTPARELLPAVADTHQFAEFFWRNLVHVPGARRATFM